MPALIFFIAELYNVVSSGGKPDENIIPIYTSDVLSLQPCFVYNRMLYRLFELEIGDPFSGFGSDCCNLRTH